MKKQFSVAKRRRLARCTKESESESSRWDDLTDDLFFEILGRLPAKDVHRSKCVSKRWFSIISKPSFARSYILRHRSLSDDTTKKMLIIKVRRNRQVGQVYTLPLPLPAPQKDSFPFAFDFIPALRPHNYDLHYRRPVTRGRTERVLSDMEFLPASGGLVLLQATFQDRTDTPKYGCNPKYYYYYVCNPLTKHWVELPLISTNDIIGFTCYYQRHGQDTRIWAHTTSFDHTVTHIADYDPNKIEFTVISVNRQKRKGVFVIRVFSSADETPGWRIFHVPFPPGYKWSDILFGRHKAIFFNSKFYWCGDHCIAAYDPFNKPLECEIIPFPPMDSSEMEHSDFMFLEACDGRLVLGTLSMVERAIVWELVDYANKVWVKKFDFELEIEGDHGLRFHSFVDGAAGDKAYVTHGYSSTRILDMENGSQQDFYKHPFKSDSGNSLQDPETFISSHEFDVGDSLQDLKKFISSHKFVAIPSLQDLETFLSSPWPSPVPLRHRK